MSAKKGTSSLFSPSHAELEEEEEVLKAKTILLSAHHIRRQELPTGTARQASNYAKAELAPSSIPAAKSSCLGILHLQFLCPAATKLESAGWAQAGTVAGQRRRADLAAQARASSREERRAEGK